ncbi:unannotated protein [freshwater metagenome]|uniref:Unannotated protein n=1 Tax=freshwater metagenome TaxID=449393 RepID=A0A6J7CX30_9ZZZZ
MLCVVVKQPLLKTREPKEIILFFNSLYRDAVVGAVAVVQVILNVIGLAGDTVEPLITI